MTSPRRNNQRLVLVVDTVVTACICSAVALLGPWFHHDSGPALQFDAVFVATCTAVLILILRLKRSYQQTFRHVSANAADRLGMLFGAAFTATLVVLSLDAVFPATMGVHLPPAAVVSAYACCVLVVPAVNWLLSRSASGGLHRPTRVVVLGTGVIANDVAARLNRSAQIELVGFVDDEPMEGGAVLGSLEDLPSICETHNVDRVVVAFSNSHPERTAWILRQLSDGVTIDIVPRFYELTGWESQLHDLHGLAVVTMGGTAPPAVRLMKRAVDIFVALAILALTGPVLLVLGIAIRLDSPGPALFKQTRLGRNREPFEIMKLRTMRSQPADCDESVVALRSERWATDSDRKTSIGSLLRRTGIDELPQLINVLRGEMSLVGPRPLIEEECTALPAWAEHRFDMRPGLTGIWQVCGQHELRPDELYRLDCQYVRDWSFLTDLRIIALTPSRLLRGGGRGATLAPGWDSVTSQAASGPKRTRTRRSTPVPEGLAHDRATARHRNHQKAG